MILVFLTILNTSYVIFNLAVSCCSVELCGGGVQFVHMFGTEGSVGKIPQHSNVLAAFRGSLSLLTTTPHTSVSSFGSPDPETVLQFILSFLFPIPCVLFLQPDLYRWLVAWLDTGINEIGQVTEGATGYRQSYRQSCSLVERVCPEANTP